MGCNHLVKGRASVNGCPTCREQDEIDIIKQFQDIEMSSKKSEAITMRWNDEGEKKKERKL